MASVAWEVFREANGRRSLADLQAIVRAIRGDAELDEEIGCVVLSDAVILAEAERIAIPADWKPNIQSRTYYDVSTGEGARVWNQLKTLDRIAAHDAFSTLLTLEGGYAEPSLVARRRGQGAFRFMVLDAYGRRCAVTGERTLPVLEAAHIRRFADDPQHEVHNGILLRSDIHRLYDAGLVTVSSDLRFRVSRSIERDYSNGKIYYALDGKTIAVPQEPQKRPAASALSWHEANVFRP